MKGKPQRVYVITRVDADENDHVLGVWANEEDIIPAMKNLFEWCTDIEIVDQWILGKDKDGTSEWIAYITCASVQYDASGMEKETDDDDE